MTDEGQVDEQADDEVVELHVPHPMTCTIGELREIRDVFHVDLIPVFNEHGVLTIDVLEPLAYLGYRRQGLPQAKARKAAAGVNAMQMVPDELPGAEPEGDESPNPTSSVT
jgi:hypothetical protein